MTLRSPSIVRARKPGREGSKVFVGLGRAALLRKVSQAGVPGLPEQRGAWQPDPGAHQPGTGKCLP